MKTPSDPRPKKPSSAKINGNLDLDASPSNQTMVSTSSQVRSKPTTAGGKEFSRPLPIAQKRQSQAVYSFKSKKIFKDVYEMHFLETIVEFKFYDAVTIKRTKSQWPSLYVTNVSKRDQDRIEDVYDDMLKGEEGVDVFKNGEFFVALNKNSNFFNIERNSIDQICDDTTYEVNLAIKISGLKYKTDEEDWTPIMSCWQVMVLGKHDDKKKEACIF